jgi:hypothetical protein
MSVLFRTCPGGEVLKKKGAIGPVAQGWPMNGVSRATRREPAESDGQIAHYFDALAIEIERAIQGLPDHPDSADMLQHLQRAKALADRGAGLARKLTSE